MPVVLSFCHGPIFIPWAEIVRIEKVTGVQIDMELDLRDVAASGRARFVPKTLFVDSEVHWTENPLRVDYGDSGKKPAKPSDILGSIAKRHSHDSGADGLKIAVSPKGPADLASIKAGAHKRTFASNKKRT
jgi:putative intracellular protease/amidase